MKKGASTMAPIKHTLSLLGMELHIQNGIETLSKKIVGYVESVIEIFCIMKPSL
jgi:hypothetical protein